MKRTRQTFHKDTNEVPKFISGCRYFEGEDTNYSERIKLNSETQKQWLLEQKKENDNLRKMEKQEEQAYADQSLILNRMRGMLEDEMTLKRQQMNKKIQEENKRLSLEKNQRDEKWKKDQERLNQWEIANSVNSDIMTENFNTTKSSFSQSRYVPYHFKGLDPQQKEQIIAQREQQIKEKKEAKEFEREQERQWAVQQEVNRQLMLMNELDLQEKQRKMQEMLKTQHKKDKVEKEARWSNYFGEKEPIPEL